MFKLVDSTDPVLRQSTLEFDFSQTTVDPQQLSNEMIKTMGHFNGIGLAGPQVNVPLAIFVMGWDDKFTTVINPRITSVSNTNVLFDEGCLSFPGLVLRIPRPETVEVEYFNVKGDKQLTTLQQLDAIVFQHEFDHLNGICFDKKVSKLKLDMAKKRLHKLKRKLKDV